MTAESLTVDGIAQNGETLTYTVSVSNSGKRDATIDITATVPLATIHVGGDDFTCSPVTESTNCVESGVIVPGRGSVDLTFKVIVDTPFNDIQNTVSAVGIDCADAANSCTVDTPGEEADVVDPVLAVVSPADGQFVAETGFVVMGTASDVGGIASIVVFDGTGDHQADYNSLDDTWTVNLPPYPGGSDISLTVTATDNSNNQTVSPSIVVQVQPTQARHLINRISYGITPALLAEIKGGSFIPANYRTEQLNPVISSGCLDPVAAHTSPSIFEPFLTLPIVTRNDLQNYAILMAAYNQCQLREVLAQFWDNHFSTDYDAVKTKSGGIESQSVIWELAENDAFRSNALGNFRNLVEISAKSPAMIYYLDGINNIAIAPNENYAREIMELHTMSVDGGYTDLDVVNVAIAFTGWTVNDPDFDPLADPYVDPVPNNSVFTCDPATHDYSDIALDLGDGVAATVISTPEPHDASSCEFSGQAVIDVLIGRAVTAEFVCEKLAELLVSDNITPAVVNACATTFATTLAANDQIAQIVEAILTTAEFTNATDYLDKVKTPLELSVGYLRNFNIVNSDVVLPLVGDLNDLRSEMDQMSMSLFRFNTPDGFSEQSVDWVSSGLMQQRFAFISDMAFNNSISGDIYLDPAAFFAANTLDSTAVQIVDYLMELVMQNKHTMLERDTALNILNNVNGFDAGGSDFDSEADVDIKQNRLRTLLAVVLNFTGYQFQ